MRVALCAVAFACKSPPIATVPIAPAIVPRVDAAPPRVLFPEVGPFRLPHTFEPTGYRAQLEIGDRKFRGHIEITGDLSEDVSLLWLHGVQLEATSAHATRDGVVVPLDVSGPRPDQLLGLQSKTPLAAGRWTLAIDYSGPIRDQEAPRPNGQGDWPALGLFRRAVGMDTYVFTQSEPIYARWIFPCIDEPDRKAPWQLTLDVPKDFVAASNTRVVRETPLDKGRKLVEFASTAPLPSYLIAFAAGPFDVVDAAAAKNGTPIRILALHDRGIKVANAASVTPLILDALEAWIGIPYRYGKLDLVVVPHPGWGAMENPGLVTFNQIDIEGDSSWVIAHELAHQWFGNLVTMAWWDDIWLNESFASFMANKTEALLAPSDPAWDEPVGRRLNIISTLRFDARIRHKVTSNDDLVFDQFTPQQSIFRGIALLDLLELHLGLEPFRKSIRAYLLAHANSNATSEELAIAISAAAPKPIDKPIMRLVDAEIQTVEARLSCEGSPHLQLADAAVDPLLVCVAYDRDGKRADTCGNVDLEHLAVPLPAKRCPRWVFPDAGATGLYRTTWTAALVDGVTRHGWAYLTPLEKLTLLREIEDDVLELDVCVKLAHDTESATADEASYVARISKYVPDDLRDRFDRWVLKRFDTLGAAIHFTNSSNDSGVRGRRDVLEALALSRDPRLEAEAQARLLSTAWFAALVVTLAANSSASLRASLLDELANRSSGNAAQRKIVIEGLSKMRGLVGVFKNEPKRLDLLTAWDGLDLFTHVCSASDRKDLVDLLDGKMQVELSRILGRIDTCIATKARLDAGFRRWLSSLPP